MKKANLYYLFSIFFPVLCFLLFTRQATPAAEFKNDIKNQKSILIDVRSIEEYKEEYIAGAININVRAEDFKTQINALDTNKTYNLYCKSGKRSLEALNIMKEAGFNKIFYLNGGIEDWKAKINKVTKVKSAVLP